MSIRNFCKATQFLNRVRQLRVQNLNSNSSIGREDATVALVKTPKNFNIAKYFVNNKYAITMPQFYEESFNYKQNQNGNNRQRRGIPMAGGLTLAFSLNIFNWSSDDDEKNDPEQKLIDTIKRSIICIQREQYDKAEQMLHLALRMAQDIQSKDGITYVFDLMANLAMEREQFKKAERIFADVMKRLFADGYSEQSPKILHISSKIAHMSQLQGELEKAHQGFIWTLQHIGKALEEMPEDKDVQELLGLTKNWFGQLLMKEGNYLEAKKLFKEAYDCLVSVYGTVNDTSITILNNISVAYVNLEKYTEAKENLLRATTIAKDLNDSAQEGVLQANLGLIYLREGLLQQARDACKLAFKLGRKMGNTDAIEQAEYCLREIKSSMHELELNLKKTEQKNFAK